MLAGTVKSILIAGAIASVAPAFLSGTQSTFFEAADHPAIRYQRQPPGDLLAQLRAGIERGEVQLSFDDQSGYLPSLLAALDVPAESQITVFSKTSLQRGLIGPSRPRMIFFNDAVTVAWPPGGFIEIAAQDARQGIMFYALQQQPGPTFTRPDACLSCHHTYATRGVPGMLMSSVRTSADGTPLPGETDAISTHRTRFSERWGGWYVTGSLLASPPADLEGRNGVPTIHESLKDTFDTTRYPTPFSDIAALSVFTHQMHAMNLLTRIGWEARLAIADPGRYSSDAVVTSARELVDYFLFVDEAALPVPVRSTSGFVEVFERRGPFDRHGRTLRDIDLRTRLFRYPCSYMIYSAAFDALPGDAKREIYARMWTVLSGADHDPRYTHVSAVDRQAIVEILRETKPGLPDYFAATNVRSGP